MSEIGGAIQEVMESYEVEVKPGNLVPVKAVRSLSGHDIKPYRIHGEKQVPFVKNDSDQKMEEGEVYAIETFGTTGRGVMHDAPGVYGYGLDPDQPRTDLALMSARKLLKTIEQHFGTIVFCRRYLDRLGVESYLAGLNSLVNHGILDMHAPLTDVPGSMVAQFEHVGPSAWDIGMQQLTTA
jgi:methionyl aminopeptidase